MSDNKKTTSRKSARGEKSGKRESSIKGGKRESGTNNGNSEKNPKHSGKTPKKDSRVKDEIYAILFLALGIFFFIALHTSAAGVVGERLKYALLGLFGLIAYVLSYILIIYSIMLFIKKAAHINARTLTLLAALILAIATLNSARYLSDIEGVKITLGYLKDTFTLGVVLENGGAVGMLIGFGLKKALGSGGLYLVCISVVFIAALLMSNTPISQALENFKERRAQKKLERAAEMDDADEGEYAAYESGDNAYGGDYDDYEKAAIASKIMNKRKIMEYMTDDELFKEDRTSEEYLKEIEEKFDAAVQKNPDSQKPKESLGARLNDATRAFIFGKKGLAPEPKPAEIDFTDETKEMPDSDFESMPDLQDDDIFYQVTSHQDNIQSEIPDEDKKTHQDGNAETEQSEAGNYITSEPNNTCEDSQYGKPTESQTEGRIIAYKLPPLNLLNRPTARIDNSKMDIGAKKAQLEKTLKDFGVNAKILNVSKGPTVTRYEIQPGTGVKVSSIVRLSDDIALNLEAKSIRMEAPIPGKAAVGIEIENEKVHPVMIREVIDSPLFKNHPSKISFAVGKDILGNAVVADLANMPHLLIAGSTGSGKSVCVNSIITSFLYRATPDEVRLLLVDPKVVELSVYNNIPHLLVPVVVDPGKAAAALHWAVMEMDDRYRKFAEFGVRKLEDYNAKVKGTDIETMPQVVIVIDELADLMMAAPSQVEASICRLAQKARAAGMHLIVATQRPSVDVITGVIKANIPSRIAFAVSSQIDSRTILDMAGAEKLVGKGDMLFNPLGQAKPIRVQGTFITDGEVEKVIEHVKAQTGEKPQEYSNDLIETIETTKIVSDQDESVDELLADAIEFVVNAKQASVSMLQRRFRVGYNRAARLIDMMEERGIVGPSDGSRPRTVIMTKEELEDE